MKQIFTFLLVVIAMSAAQKSFAQFPTIYASRQSGLWATVGAAGTWETFPGNATNTPGAPGSGSIPATSAPSGTHFIYIRAGHTVQMAASKNCLGVTIESTGSLIAGTAAAVTLKLATGGTGFTGPNSYNVTNNGTLGVAGELMTVEIPTTAGTVTFTGAGSYLIGRIRMVGGNSYSPIVNIDANMTLNQTANYALTASYNPAAGDNYVLNINTNKIVTISAADGYFHSNGVSSTGTYTYNINGTLDLTANTQTGNNLTAISPTAGTINVNVGSTGTIKTGAAFNSSPVAPGVANINVASGGVFDASLATVFNFNGNAIVTTPTSPLKRTVTGDGTRSNFPMKATAGSNISTVTISRLNTSGTTGIYAASVQNAFDNAPSDPTKCVQKQWNLSMISGTPSTSDTVRLSWVTADQGSAFNPASTVTIGHYEGGAYTYKNATVSGAGTAADPYVAYATGYTSYSPFIVSNLGVVPVSFVSFSGYNSGKTNNLQWTMAIESDISGYEVQKSTDGINFIAIGNVPFGNAQNAHYTFTDASLTGKTAYYRLKTTGTSQPQFSQTIKIQIGVKTSDLSISPNPARSVVSVTHDVADDHTVISVFSSNGSLALSQNALKGSGKTTIDISKLPAGIFRISVSNANGRTSSNFIKQ